MGGMHDFLAGSPRQIGPIRLIGPMSCGDPR